MTKARKVSANKARAVLSDILDDATRGGTTVIIRHSKPAAAIIPATEFETYYNELETYYLVRRLMVELGESIAVSTDRAIVAAVARAQDDIARGKIIWDEVTD
jgi:prevent-host-death family protein